MKNKIKTTVLYFGIGIPLVMVMVIIIWFALVIIGVDMEKRPII